MSRRKKIFFWGEMKHMNTISADAQKKLLVLGKSNTEVSVVKVAQSCGCYVIVTDQYTQPEITPARLVANEAWNISWTDYDTLESKCREVGVDGIIAGFSEFRVESMIEMCDRLGLPCYINREQLEITRDKNKFKQMCKKYNIPTVNEYTPDDPNIQFPVIIKPTDRGGSIGINVAYNAVEYEKYLAYAYSMSPSKNVVIEDFIGDGVKFDCSYYIAGKQTLLIETCDTTMLTQQKGCETMQKAWTFPSKYEKDYINQVDNNVKKMLSDLGMECGVANISFFYRNGQFYVFETGFRLGGGQSFDYQRASSGIDYLTLMIKYALGQPLVFNSNLPAERGFAVTYSVYYKPQKNSKVEHIIGKEKVQSIEELVTYLPILYEGYVAEDDKPRKIAMCTLYSKNLNVILDNIAIINSTLKVQTSTGISEVFCGLKDNEIIKAMKG